jgi:hypothetical protein
MSELYGEGPASHTGSFIRVEDRTDVTTGTHAGEADLSVVD